MYFGGILSRLRKVKTTRFFVILLNCELGFHMNNLLMLLDISCASRLGMKYSAKRMLGKQL